MRTALSPEAAASLIPDGASVMIGGFMGVGSPHRLIAALVARGVRGLAVIANDTARPGIGIGRLVTAGCVARVVASHIGTNPEGLVLRETAPGVSVDEVRAATAAPLIANTVREMAL